MKKRLSFIMVLGVIIFGLIAVIGCGGDTKYTWYEDSDGDTYGNPEVTREASSQPDGYVKDNTDCDDTNVLIHPYAPEDGNNGTDDNCDGIVDMLVLYPDIDLDEYGDENAQPILANQATSGLVENNADCDDSDHDINPGVDEICDDGIDNDCTDGDSSETAWYLDSDTDTYGDPNNSIIACLQPDGYVADNSDCDDNNININPGVDEICDDGIDNDCTDGDSSETAWYPDSDTDTYGNPNNSIIACLQPTGYVADNSDCDDNKIDVNPGETEICGDGIDNDCSGEDYAGSAWYFDNDKDGYGNPGNSIIACSQPAAYVANNSDCDDNNIDVHPGGYEICRNGIDDNCYASDNYSCPSGCIVTNGNVFFWDGCGNNPVNIGEFIPEGTPIFSYRLIMGCGSIYMDSTECIGMGNRGTWASGGF